MDINLVLAYCDKILDLLIGICCFYVYLDLGSAFANWIRSCAELRKAKASQIKNGLNTENGVDINNPTGK